MKYRKTNITVIIIFMLLIIAPLIKTNTEQGAVSEIDNKALAESPMLSIWTPTFSAAVDSYLNDRIGYRFDYIKWYEKMHDVAFDMLIHPFYMYGKDKEVFATFDMLYYDNDAYLTDFGDFVSQMQKYCEDKDIQFVFQWEPDKSAIKSELLPEGLYYDFSWIDNMFKDFDERKINYVDNISLLNELDDCGEFVYNHKYDAGHYNDNGAYYSVNNVLENLNRTNPSVHVNSPGEVEFGTTIAETLTQSDFLINEEVPSNKIRNTKFKAVDKYTSDIYIDPSTKSFLCAYYENVERQVDGAPRGLVFGGSHMHMNYKYYANSFSEYLSVPNYVNVVNYEYYIEKFNPDVVVFEICQRTIGEDCFPIHKKDELKANILAYEESK